MKIPSRILSVSLSGIFALTCLWPGATVMAQQAATLDKNDPDPNAVRTVTFSEFDVSIVNQKLALTVPELRPGSVVYMKETPLEPFGDNVFRVVGGSFYGNFITFETSNDGSMRLKWRNYTFDKQRDSSQ